MKSKTLCSLIVMYKVRLNTYSYDHFLKYVHILEKGKPLIFVCQMSSVEHVFSTMKVEKSNLCNKMEDLWLNDRFVTYV